MSKSYENSALLCLVCWPSLPIPCNIRQGAQNFGTSRLWFPKTTLCLTKKFLACIPEARVWRGVVWEVGLIGLAYGHRMTQYVTQIGAICRRYGLNMVEHGWIWLNMVEQCWTWLNVAKDGWRWLVCKILRDVECIGGTTGSEILEQSWTEVETDTLNQAKIG